jgi:hypothetical protein
MGKLIQHGPVGVGGAHSAERAATRGEKQAHATTQFKRHDLRSRGGMCSPPSPRQTLGATGQQPAHRSPLQIMGKAVKAGTLGEHGNAQRLRTFFVLSSVF